MALWNAEDGPAGLHERAHPSRAHTPLSKLMIRRPTQKKTPEDETALHGPREKLARLGTARAKARQDPGVDSCGPASTRKKCNVADIVSKFEPTILCDIRSWDYATFPGHFDMVWASPVCTEYSRALTTRPRRLLEGDTLVLSALELQGRVLQGPRVGVLEWLVMKEVALRSGWSRGSGSFRSR